MRVIEAGIILQNTAYRICSHISIASVHNIAEAADHIFKINQIIVKFREYRLAIHFSVVGFEKACDRRNPTR
jgi:hypothetical protein